jgi:hypothetical protein
MTNTIRCPYGCRRSVLRERLADHWIVEHLRQAAVRAYGLEDLRRLDRVRNGRYGYDDGETTAG